MKVSLLIVVLFYLFYKSVYAAKAKPKDIFSLQLDPSYQDGEHIFLKAGEKKEIWCKGQSYKQKIDWYNPDGELVERQATNRVYVQEHLQGSLKSPRIFRHTLTITNALTVDTGVWECRSGDLKQTVELCVTDTADFLDTPEEDTVDEGRTISLTCRVKGDPEPDIIWYKNGEQITDDPDIGKYSYGIKYNHEGLEGYLTIKSVEPKDLGVYTCKTIQKSPLSGDCIYESGLNITLHVNHRPLFDIETSTFVFLKPGEKDLLICDPSVYPAPEFRWFMGKDDEMQEMSEKYFEVSANHSLSTFSIVGNSTTFGQKVKCEAKNAFGEAYNDFIILELKKPTVPTLVSVTNQTTNEITFNVTWDLNEPDEPFPIQHFTVQYLVKTSGFTPTRDVHWMKAKTRKMQYEDSVFLSPEASFTLGDLEEDTEYWVRLRAINPAGISAWTAPLLVSTTIPEEEEESPLLTQIPAEDILSDILFGLFLSAAIAVSVAGCILVIKRL